MHTSTYLVLIVTTVALLHLVPVSATAQTPQLSNHSSSSSAEFDNQGLADNKFANLTGGDANGEERMSRLFKVFKFSSKTKEIDSKLAKTLSVDDKTLRRAVSIQKDPEAQAAILKNKDVIDLTNQAKSGKLKVNDNTVENLGKSVVKSGGLWRGKAAKSARWFWYVVGLAALGFAIFLAVAYSKRTG